MQWLYLNILSNQLQCHPLNEFNLDYWEWKSVFLIFNSGKKCSFLKEQGTKWNFCWFIANFSYLYSFFCCFITIPVARKIKHLNDLWRITLEICHFLHVWSLWQIKNGVDVAGKKETLYVKQHVIHTKCNWFQSWNICYIQKNVKNDR